MSNIYFKINYFKICKENHNTCKNKNKFIALETREHHQIL